MGPLVLKDLLLQKKYLTVMILYLLFASLFITMNGKGADFSFSFIAFPLIYLLGTTSMAHDETAYRYLAILPVKRWKIVAVKYLTVCLYFFLIMTFYGLVGVILNLLPFLPGFPPLTLESLFLVFAGILVFFGVNYPVLFWFGPIKARWINFILFFLFFFLMNAATESPEIMDRVNDVLNGLDRFPGGGVAFFTLFAVLLYLLSALLSIRLFLKRDL